MPSPPPKIYKRLGKRVQRIREPKMSQEKLAEKARITEGYVTKIEGGTKRVQLDKLEQIADALGCELADFFPKRRPVPGRARSRAAETSRSYGAPAFQATGAQLEDLFEIVRDLDREAFRLLAALAERLTRTRR